MVATYYQPVTTQNNHGSHLREIQGDPAIKRGRIAQRGIRKILGQVEDITQREIGLEVLRVNNILRGENYRDWWIFRGES